jgi:hypothetical protein
MCSNDDLVKLGACEFEHYVDVLFQGSRKRGDGYCPIIKRLYPELDNDYLVKLKRLTCAALAARKWFRQHGQPGIILPLNFADIERAQRDEESRVNLVGLYGSSLMMLEYDYLTHPPFHDYACGVMAYKHAPHYAYLRDDPELQQEFPPKPLAGLDKGLNWRTPEMIAESLAVHERAIQRLRDQNASEATLKVWIDERDSYFGTIST